MVLGEIGSALIDTGAILTAIILAWEWYDPELVFMAAILMGTGMIFVRFDMFTRVRALNG